MVVVYPQEIVFFQGRQMEGMEVDCLNLKADSAWMF